MTECKYNISVRYENVNCVFAPKMVLYALVCSAKHLNPLLETLTKLPPIFTENLCD